MLRKLYWPVSLEVKCACGTPQSQAEFRSSAGHSLNSTGTTHHTVRQTAFVNKAGLEGEECRG
jgi:hypothetical protein